MKILIAYDGSAAADAAVREALQLPWPTGTELRLATVVEWPIPLEPPFPVDYPGPAVEAVRAITVSRAKEAQARAKQVLQARTDLTVTTELREGSPKHGLLDMVETWKPDLVIAGYTGKTGLKRIFPGSVCHALLTNVPCNVLIVKPSAD